MTTENADFIKLLAKINSLRKEVISCDWTPEGSMKLSGNLIKYISIAQMKANLAPLFAKVGVELLPTMGMPIYNEDARTWIVPLHVKMYDIATGACVESDFVGSGEGSKGIAVGTSYAIKMFLSTTFLLADGIDPDKDGIGNTITTFVPKSTQEKEAQIEKISEKAETPVPVAEDVPAKAPEAPKAEPSAPKTPKYSKLQGNTIKRILDSLPERVAAGKINALEAESIKAEAADLGSSDEAKQFINKYLDG